MRVPKSYLLPALLLGCGGEPSSDHAAAVAPAAAAELTCAEDATAAPVLDGLAPSMLTQTAPGHLAASGTRAVLAGDADVALTKALARCALPAGARAVKQDGGGGSVCFPGQLGLAPDWQAGPCGDDCRETLSACVAALLNRDGRRVGIRITPAPDGGDAGHPLEEGRFFGDLAATPPLLFVCAGSGAAGAPQARRTCASEGACGLTLVGSCASACTAEGCRDGTGRLWRHPVTVYLKDKLEAINHALGSGVVVAGDAIRDVDDGDWVSFRDVDFGAAGSVRTFTAWLASPKFGNQIEAWLDRPLGTYLGTILTQRTSDDPARPVEAAQSAPVNTAAISGRHTVYIHFDGPENATASNGLGRDLGSFTHFQFR